MECDVHIDVQVKNSNNMKMKRSLMAVLVILSALVASAHTYDGKDRVLDKARKAVASNFDNNWKVFAKSASLVIGEGVGLEEAKEWLEASLSVQKTPFNLEVMGDYYFAIGDRNAAVKYYHQSLLLLKENNLNPDTGNLQVKIWKAR